MRPLALVACEYGPMALGPISVAMISFTMPPVVQKLEIGKSKTANPAGTERQNDVPYFWATSPTALP
jgi:hypothetical protein